MLIFNLNNMGRIKEIFIKILNEHDGEFPEGYTLSQYLSDELSKETQFKTKTQACEAAQGIKENAKPSQEKCISKD